MVADIRQIQLGIEDKQANFDELEKRRSREAKAAASGQKRVEHMRAVLQRATAHCNLKKSLLQEKQELIKSLEQEIQQVSSLCFGICVSGVSWRVSCCVLQRND